MDSIWNIGDSDMYKKVEIPVNISVGIQTYKGQDCIKITSMDIPSFHLYTMDSEDDIIKKLPKLIRFFLDEQNRIGDSW